MTSFTLRRTRFPRKVADGRFEIRKTLGAGCFGKVYSAIHTETKEQVAVKFEDLSHGPSQLQHEAEMLKLLRGDQMRPQGFAEHYYSGREGMCQMLVMECLGRDLEDRLQQCRGTFQTKTAVLIAEQLLQRLEYLHAKGIVHQDIKPENLAFGVGDRQHHLYLIDFGLSKRYYERRHVKMHQHPGLIGTARYASINAHKGLEQSRRDDLEAVGHMLLYFLRGSLPWSGLAAKNMTEKLKKIQKKKESIPIPEMFAGLPREFEQCLTYCRCLGFKERPDYAFLRQLFRGLRERLSGQIGQPLEDHDFQWNAGKDLGPLAPLDLDATYPQPDDSRRNFLGGCFCTSKVRSPEACAPEQAKTEASADLMLTDVKKLPKEADVGITGTRAAPPLFMASVGGA